MERTQFVWQLYLLRTGVLHSCTAYITVACFWFYPCKDPGDEVERYFAAERESMDCDDLGDWKNEYSFPNVRLPVENS